MWQKIILDVECIVCNKTLQKIKHDPREVLRKMGKITNRRSRTPNWSLQEKQYLLHLIKERKGVVITKSNNGPNYSEEKDVAWNEILRELTIKFGNKFIGSSIKKVKTQWQNMKRIAREEIALNASDFKLYTKLSLEVCHILELFKDGVLKDDAENLNDTTLTTDVEIKAERIEEEANVIECCDSPKNPVEMDVEEIKENNLQSVEHLESSGSDNTDIIDFEIEEPAPHPTTEHIEVKDAASMTDAYFHDFPSFNPFHRDLQEFFKYTAEEKTLKMETLQEERQVVRAMRDTAELNKITAEQRLKHVLWVKKQETL